METTKALWVLLFLWCIIRGTDGLGSPRLTAEQHHARFRERAATRRSLDECGKSQSGRVYYPTDYGADPTGVQESSDAIQGAVQEAFDVQKGLELLPGVNDLGGVVVDLQGGNYKISKPIRFPPGGGGNVVIQGGTVRATESFPADEYLIELWSTSSKRLPREGSHKTDAADGGSDAGQSPLGVYYEDITIRDILFDSNYTGGGLLVVDSVRTRIDNCFFIHFSTGGILVEGGHETFISSSFLGQHLTIGGDPQERNFSGVAIDLASNDNAITNVAIFSAATGVVLRGQANILTGVHCYNKATNWGGVGILVKLAGLGQTRISNCYMDYTGIVLEDPVQVHVTNAFFLGNAGILLKSVKGEVSGLNIVDNMFSGGGGETPIVALDESNGPFTSVDQVVIDRNNVLNMTLKATVGRMAVSGHGRRWVADFSPLLVFPDRINQLQYSLYVRGKKRFPLHAVTSVSNNTVVVESRRAVDGVVSMLVDQNSMPGENNLLFK